MMKHSVTRGPDERAPRDPARHPGASTAPPRWSTSSCAPTSRVSFTELSEETGLARSTTSRLLAALERTELSSATPPAAYVAGPLFALHAARHDPWPQMARLARPVLEAVGEQTGETVHLGVRPRRRRSCTSRQVESTYLPRRPRLEPGRRTRRTARRWARCSTPSDCSPLPAGRLERRTDRTVATREALRRRARARSAAQRLRRPPSTSSRSGSPASPRPSPAGTACVAALGVSGPTARLQDRVDQIGRLLIEQADALSALLRRRTRTAPTAHKEGAA